MCYESLSVFLKGDGRFDPLGSGILLGNFKVRKIIQTIKLHREEMEL